jgi:hypothetical protein
MEASIFMNTAMPRKAERMSIPRLGEFYSDVLKVDAWINDRSVPTQAQSLLCAKLQERYPIIQERVAYLAAKRNISPEEMWRQILNGEAIRLDDMTDEDLKYKSGDEG